MESAGVPIEVLLVEDNPGDVRLIKEALRDCTIPLHLTVAQDGEEALQILFNKSEGKTPLRPHVILLDLNLPKRSGHEVLRDIKEDINLRSIPVVIVSSAGSAEDVNRSYNLAANCYIRKPMDLDTALQTIRDICTFWFQRVTLPIT
jgi:two-component system, chemotaxis family, response regulator Rcp1